MNVITINIDSIDRTEKISPMSFNLSRGLTNQVDTATFTIERTKSADYKPTMLDSVEMVDADSNVIFAGSIVIMDETVNDGVEYVKCTCKDWSFEMDRKLVVATFEDETVEDIIAFINTNYLTGFTITNVSCETVIDYIAFNYEYPSKCIQQLAELVKFDWFVDEDKDIHFFGKNATTAPFGLSDTNGNYYIDSLNIKKDATKIKNTITVRGGEYLGDSYTEKYNADGVQTTFPIVNKYSGITVTVASASKTVGIDNIDDPDDFDCLYNFQEKAVKFREANKPTIGQLVEVQGMPYIPVLSRRTDTASVSTYGIFEYKIIDNTINSKVSAQDRAKAELNQYKDALDEGSFETKVNGLEVGQNIHVQSTLRGIDETFVITRITTTIRPDSLHHKCTLTTTKTFGMVEFLQQLLMKKDKEIKISADEVLDELLEFSDSFSIEDEVGTPTTNEAPYTYAGGSNDAVWNFSTWS